MLFTQNVFERDLNQILTEAAKLPTSDNLHNLNIFFEKIQAHSSTSRSKSEAFLTSHRMKDEN